MCENKESEVFKMKLRRKLVAMVMAGVMAMSVLGTTALACTNNPGTCVRNRGGHFLPQNWPTNTITVSGMPNSYQYNANLLTTRVDVRNGESG
jgi:hypothetical protein